MSDDSNTLFRMCLASFWMREKGLLSEGPDKTIEELRRLLKEHMTQKANGLSSRRLDMEVSEEFPGYLKYKIGSIPIYFPWIIIEDLPEPEVIAELASFCERLIVGHFSTICLSGSALYFGALRSVSDIDLLEYHPNADDEKIDKIAPDGFWRFRKRKNYFEFLTFSDFYGSVEITNKIVKIDYFTKGDMASIKSSPYQEAPLVHTPRELHDPFAMGRYINFLATQSLSYMHTFPEKAAKRLLPMSRILERLSIADSIIYAFESVEVQRALKVRQKTSVLKTAAKIAEKSEELMVRVKSEIDDCRDGQSGEYRPSEVELACISSLSGAISHICLTNKKYLNSLASPL